MADTLDFAYHLTLHCNITQPSLHTQSFFLKKKLPVAQSLNVRNLYYKMLVGPANSEGIMTYPWVLCVTEFMGALGYCIPSWQHPCSGE